MSTSSDPRPRLRRWLLCSVLAVLWALVPGICGAQPHAAPPSVHEALRDLLQAPAYASPARAGGKLAGLRAFYEARDYQPAWSSPAAVRALTLALRGIEADGLTPSDYGADRLEALQLRAATRGDVQALARFDLAATGHWLRALRDLRYGKVDPGRVEDGAELMRARAPDPGGLDAAEGLSLDAAGDGLDAALVRARPPYAVYERLRQALAGLHELQARGGWPHIPAPGGNARSLKPGMRDPAVPALRRRLLPTAPAPGPEQAELYDEALAEAVRSYQTEQHLAADAAVGGRTLAALNVPVEQRVDQVRVNLERARWLLHDLPPEFVVVDIAGFRLSYYRDGKPYWRTSVVVGEPYKRTPSLRSRIERVELNPVWLVPPSITSKEIAPQLARDPAYLQKHAMRVFTPDGVERSPSEVDWSRPYSFRLRQDSGEKNSLGRLVIRFPNDYNVYLHDTPAQALFASDRRARSHGCIRVQNVIELARLLLDDPAWDEAAIRAAIATGENRQLRLTRPVPLILYYWTVDVTGDGVAFKADIYRRDAALLAQLDRPLPALADEAL